MELDPQSETGKRLHSVLTNWNNNNSPKLALDKIKRALVVFSTDIENEDKFVSLLYGQSVVDECPLALSQRVPSVFLRVQYGIESVLNKKCWKELIVALEMSKNGKVLTRMLSWAEKSLNKEQNASKSLSIHLAPPRVESSKSLSQLPPGSWTLRRREIQCKGEDLERSALEICSNKIISGMDNGQIKIYNSDDLRCQTTLNYCTEQAGVTCVQCTSTEVIAGYSDGNICIWDVEKGIPKQTFAIENVKDIRRRYPTCMRWRDPKLVIVTNLGGVEIWHRCNSTFNLLGSWNSKKGSVHQVDFTENYVLLRSSGGNVEVKYFNGDPFRSISGPGELLCMASIEGRIITGSEDQMVQIWDVETGACVIGLEGHEENIRAVDAHDGVIASVDDSGKIILWSAKAALEGQQIKLHSLNLDRQNPEDETFDIRLGTSFLVSSALDTTSLSLMVIDFPQERT